MNKAQFDKFAHNYDTVLADSLQADGSDLAYYSSYKVGLLRRLAAPGVSNILDFGCGIGKTVALLRNAFPSASVDGCDVSSEALDVARSNNPEASFFLPEELYTNQSSYDLAFVANVVHHIPTNERAAWFSKLQGLIRPGGCVCFFEHNPLNPIVRLIVRNCPLDEDAVLVPPAELYRISERAGCHVITWGYTLFFNARLRSLSFLESYLRWLPLGAQYYMQVQC